MSTTDQDPTADQPFTDSQALLDQLVEEGHAGTAVQEVIERMVERGEFEHEPGEVMEHLLLTPAEVLAVRARVETSATEDRKTSSTSTHPRPGPAEPVAGWVSDALADWTSEPAFHNESVDDVFMTDCPGWCEDRPHGFAWGVEDRRHSGPPCRVPLTHEDAQSYGGGEYQLETARAYLVQEWRSGTPLIDLGKGADPGMKLTLDEAEKFAAMLDRARRGRAEGGRPRCLTWCRCTIRTARPSEQGAGRSRRGATCGASCGSGWWDAEDTSAAGERAE